MIPNKYFIKEQIFRVSSLDFTMLMTSEQETRADACSITAEQQSIKQKYMKTNLKNKKGG